MCVCVCRFGLNKIYFIRNNTLTRSLTANSVTDTVSSRDHLSEKAEKTKISVWGENMQKLKSVKHEVLQHSISRRKTFCQLDCAGFAQGH